MRHFHLLFFIDKHHDFKKGHLFVLVAETGPPFGFCFLIHYLRSDC